MNIELCQEALDYGTQANKAFEAAGGDELVRLAQQEPERRGAPVEAVLDMLGAPDLRPRRTPEELEAAAALCRAAGYWAAPYPVAERLARPDDLDADGLVVVAPHAPAAAIAGLALQWVAVSLDGQRSRATARDATHARPAFVTPLDLEPIDDAGTDDATLALVLPCWTLLGMLDRAIDLARIHVVEREQFGQPLASFQAVQFQLTEAEVERVGLEQLAGYAVWSIESGSPDALTDALACRLAAIEAADVVFKVAHQLHGAIGFCDETALSWLSRSSEPLRRLPYGRSVTLDHLRSRLGQRDLSGLFSEGTK